MQLDSVKLANAFAVAMSILWILCSAFVWILPEFTMQSFTWMMHGIELPAWNLNFGNFLSGGISLMVSAWVTGWVLGWSWEAVGGNKRR